MLSPIPHLDSDQWRIYNKMPAAIKNSHRERSFIVTGYAGTGKSHVVHKLTNSLQGEFSVMVHTWAGVAARVLNGNTMMSYCGLRYDDSGIPGDN